MVGLYCASFAQVPKRITLDIDDTFDAVHGGQQLPAQQRLSSDSCSSACPAWPPSDATPRQKSQPAQAPQPKTKPHAVPSKESAAIAVVTDLTKAEIQRRNPPPRHKRTPVMHRSA